MATKGFEGTRLPSSREVRRWFAGQAYVRRSKHGARVRAAKSLDSAVLCTLDPDTAVIVTHTEDVADGAGEKTLRSRLIHPVDGWVSSKLLVKACLLKGYLGRRAAGLGKALELCFMEGGELITITDPLAKDISEFFRREPGLRQYFELSEHASKEFAERALPPPPPVADADAKLLMVVISCRKNERLWPGIRKRLAAAPTGADETRRSEPRELLPGPRDAQGVRGAARRARRPGRAARPRGARRGSHVYAPFLRAGALSSGWQQTIELENPKKRLFVAPVRCVEPLRRATWRALGAHHHATSESFVSAALSAASTQDGVSADNRTPPGCPAARRGTRGFPRRPPWNNGTSYLRERPLGAPQLVRIRPFSCLHMPTQDRSLVQSRRDRDEFGSELTWTSSS